MNIIKTDSIEEVCRLHKKIFFCEFPVESYYNKEKEYPVLIFLYLENGKYIGYSIIINQKNKLNLYAWYGGLLPEYQNMGLNNKFIEFLKKLARDMNYTSVTLATTNKRPNMIIQAVKNGFEIYDIKKREISEHSEGNKIYFKYLC